MTVQRTWTELVSRNPMLVEIARFRRKLISANGNAALSAVILSVIGIVYVGIISLIVTYREDIDPRALLWTQGILFVLLAPTLLHGSIAGERERRSWDLLLVAPITKAQIVIGKFMGALSAVAIGTAFFVFPVGVTAFSYKRFNSEMDFLSLGMTEAVVLSFTVLVCALTLFISARVKSSFMALGATLGTLGFSLLVVPALLEALFSTTGSMSNFYSDSILYLHPVEALSRMSYSTYDNGVEHFVSNAWFGLPHVLVYLGLTGVLLAWSINTLNFAENEVKFIPKAKS